MKNLLFLSVNSSYSHSSLALPILHNAAGNVPDWHWDCIECTIDEDPTETAIQMADRQPTLACATLYIFNRDRVLEILSRFHALAPSATIVLGGPECSGQSASELLERYSFIHDIFIGESEGLFAEYLAKYNKNSPRRIFPEKGFAIYESWHEKFPVNDIFFKTDKAFVQLETSRGCPIGCKYCTSSNIKLRMKELPEVEKEIAVLHDKGVRKIRLLDRTFNFPQWRGTALLKLFREKFSDIEFHLEIHPQFIDDELKKELISAPNLHIETGIQSFDEKVQHAIGRNCKKNDAVNGLKFLASCPNFETHADLICGLPQQNLNTIINDIIELIKCGTDEIQLETLKILHGTPLQREADETGLIYSPVPPYDVMETDDLSRHDIIYARCLSRILDIFHNHHALRPVFRKLNLTESNNLRIFADHMLEKGIGLKCVVDLKKRLLLLTDFIKKYPSSDAEFEICKTWINNNYPLSEIPFGTLKKFDEKIPLCITKSNDKLFSHKDTKIWTLCCKDKVFHFAVNRHFKLNGAACSWECSLSRTPEKKNK